MKKLSKGGAATLLAALAVTLVPLQRAAAVELIKDLDCALTQTTHKDAQYCLKVFNTCNTPLISRIEETGGAQKDSAPIPKGERGSVCASVPFTFLGHYITGPLAQ